jgi:hypothetical protein
MNRNVLALALGVCLIGAVAPLAMGGCGGSARVATETGNPPGIDTRRLRLEWAGDVVELIGEPGAAPPGARVRLRNSRTGESVSGNADTDGSVRLSMRGGLSDPYEVIVSSETGEAATPISATDPALPADLGALSCIDLESQLGQVIASSFERGSTACIAEDDCIRADWGGGCYDGCGSSVLSRTGESEARADAEQATAAVCAELGRCEQGAPSCPGSGPTPLIRCIDGTCLGRSITQLSCQELGDEAYIQSIGAVQVLSDRACTVDADCTIVSYDVPCSQGRCGGGAVAGLRTQQALDRVSEVTAAFCGQFDAQGCPPPMGPRCIAQFEELRAICQDNLCEVEPTLSP